MRRFRELIVAIVIALLLVAGAGVSAGWPTRPAESQSTWTPVFSDTFDVVSSAWTITDESAKGYEWGIAAYTRTGELDSGLWAAGGGTTAEGQVWPTGSYTNGMQTLAVAGPFTLSRAAAEVRMTVDVLNQSLPGDVLYVELSTDGVNPLGWNAVSIDGTSWQSITRTTGSMAAGEELWVFILFRSDGSGVSTGPVVDNVRLEALESYDIYLPLIRLDPTPTPLPIYHDDFSDPASGWYVGEAIRYNPNTGVNETVADMGYGSGHYEINVPMDFRGGGTVDTWFVWPAEYAPLPAPMKPLPPCYSVEVRARLIPLHVGEDYSPWWAHWGVVFGANDARSELYTYQVNANHLLGMLRYQNYTYPGNREYEGQNIETAIYQWPDTEPHEHWSGDELAYPSYAYHTLRVDLDLVWAKFYLNGTGVATANISGMPRDQIGVIGGSYEVTPVEVEFDYFHYEPIECSAQ